MCLIKQGLDGTLLKNHQFGLALGFGAGRRVAAAGGVCGAVLAPGPAGALGCSGWPGCPTRVRGSSVCTAWALLGAVVKLLVS